MMYKKIMNFYKKYALFRSRFTVREVIKLMEDDDNR